MFPKESRVQSGKTEYSPDDETAQNLPQYLRGWNEMHELFGLPNGIFLLLETFLRYVQFES